MVTSALASRRHVISHEMFRTRLYRRCKSAPTNRPATHQHPHPTTTTTTTTTTIPVHDTCHHFTTPQKVRAVPLPHCPTQLSTHLFTIVATAQALDYSRKIQRLHSSPHPTVYIPLHRENPHLFAVLATSLERRRKIQHIHPPTHTTNYARPLTPLHDSCDHSRTSLKYSTSTFYTPPYGEHPYFP